jgi:hypothetical protein
MLHVTVPVNTTATVEIPAPSVEAVQESGRPASDAEGVSDLRVEDGTVVGELGSGTYRFKVEENA